MITELRRRAYLNAMQVTSWLPAQVLPFAAPSRIQLLAADLPAEPAPDLPAGQASSAQATATVAPISQPPVSAMQALRARLDQAQPPAASMPPVLPAVLEDSPVSTPAAAVPRFSLQLYRAGACLLLVELPTGEAFQSRDPAYLLLRDMLRAAGLPDSPQLVGDPVRWPLLAGGNLDQGPDAARDFLQGYLVARMEDQPGTACLWLVGLPAMRHAGEVGADMYHRELQIEGIGSAWAVPGLELLMEEPPLKAPLWQAMRRLMQRWKPVNA
ncbi:MAG TPA: energy transducer TonB [Pseudomonas sp.]|nr:energy transducer TonB [Pseudomonas sp.]